MKVLPDTSFLIDLLRGRREAVDLSAALRAQGAVAFLSPLVLFELRFGFLWRGDRVEESLFEAAVADMPMAELSEHATTHAADLQVQMMRKGIALGQTDCLIAGTAAAGRYVLVTGDAGMARVQETGIPVHYYGA